MNKIVQMIQDAKAYSLLFVGNWYKWGGDDPSGFDCSGLVIEVLKSVGVLPRVGDWTADDLYRRFEEHKVKTPEAGCLAFWWLFGGTATAKELFILSFVLMITEQ